MCSWGTCHDDLLQFFSFIHKSTKNKNKSLKTSFSDKITINKGLEKITGLSVISIQQIY